MLGKVAFGPLVPYAAGIFAIGVIVYLIDDRAFNSGVRQTVERYEAAMNAEKERLQEANREALEEAKKRERELEKQLEARNEEIKSILEEGRNDPDADRGSIGLDGVRRIDRIR